MTARQGLPIIARLMQAQTSMNPRIAENLLHIRERIARAAASAGREPGEVRLVAVTKYQEIGEMQALCEAGCRVLGESRVQDWKRKSEQMAERGVAVDEWHFIGHLQTNKARQVLEGFALIHGVDSLKLARTLQREAEKRETEPLNILLQVNVADEQSKFGLSPDETPGAVREVAALDKLRCRGLMTMAPHEDDPQVVRPVFRRLRELRDTIRAEQIDGLEDFGELSMGMSNDFEIAVEEGATLVRLGSALFA